MTECKKRKVVLNDVRFNASGLTARIKYGDLKSVFDAARSSGTDIRILSKKGLPFILYHYRKRAGIPLGALSAAVICFFLFSSVWCIDVDGNNKLAESEVLRELYAAGVYIGAKKKNIDCNAAEDALENKFGCISHAAVNIAGARIYVDIEETVGSENTGGKNGCCNIIAAKSGEIVKADIFAGISDITPGMPVVKGDILVSGIIPLKNGGVRFVGSKADIIARTENTISGAEPSADRMRRVRENKNRYSLCVFGVKIPFGTCKREAVYSESKYFLDGGDIVFPCGILRENILLFEKTRDTLSPEELSLAAFAHFSENAAAVYENTKVLSCIFCPDEKNGVRAKYTSEENIAEEKSFTVEDGSILSPAAN